VGVADYKVWTTIAPEHYEKVKEAARELFPEEWEKCHNFLRHKSILISPEQLKEKKIPFGQVVQGPREIIITYCRVSTPSFIGIDLGIHCVDILSLG